MTIANLTFWDAHLHLGDWPHILITDPSVQGLIKRMDELRIEFGLISSFRALGKEFEAGNREVEELCQSYPNRFRGYLVVPPGETGKAMIENARDAVWVGVKIHSDFLNMPFSDESWTPVLSAVQERGWVALVHSGDWKAVKQRSNEFSNIRFINAHAPLGLKPSQLLDLTELANLWVDLAGSRLPEGWLKESENLGITNHLLFGTDMPFLDGAYTIGALLYAGLSGVTLNNIAKLNLQRLLNQAL